MTNLVIFNDVEWKPPIKSELLKPPVVKLSVRFPGTDLDEMTGKHRKSFDKHFKSFDTKFDALGKSKIKEIQEAVSDTEQRLREKKTKQPPEQVVETANKLLAQAFKVFEQQIQKLAQDCYEDALAQACAEMKLRLVKARAKAVAKIVVISLLILTAAALTIAASAVTGGAAAPIVIAAILTGGAALWKVYKEVRGGWANATNQIKQIQKDIAELEEATKTLKSIGEKQKALGEAALSDKLKAAKTLLSGKLDGLDKHVGQLDKFVFEAREQLKAQQADLALVLQKARDSGDPGLVKKADALELAIKESMTALSGMKDVQTEAAKVRAEFAAQKLPELGALDRLVQRVHEAGPYLKKVADGVKEVIDLAQKLSAALK